MTATILIVDDSEDDQLLYRRAFKDFDYALISASSAEAGFAHISGASRPDLILLDYNLPDMDGLGFMQRLSDYSDTPIPIVMLTGEGNAAVAVNVMKRGANDYLVKDTEGRYLSQLPGVAWRVMTAHSQREQLQRLRQEAENKFRLLFESASDGLVLVSRSGRIRDINRIGHERLGYAKGEMLGRRIAEFDLSEFAHKVPERVAQIMRDRQATFESVHVRKDGSRIPVEINARLVELNGEKMLYSAIRDITERKKSEEMLKKYKLVIDRANDGYWVNDTKGNLLDANEAYARMSGYTVAELIGMHISQLDAIDQPEDVAARCARIIAQGHERFETQHRCKDGHLIDIEVSATYMPETQQFFVFSRDITERKRTDEVLRVAAAVFETHDAIVITDAKANIVRVNLAFTEITGYSPEDVMGKNPRIMSSGRQDRSFYIEMWQQLLHTGSWAGEIWDRRKSGQIYPKWLTITAVRNERQVTTNYVAIFSDITARKQTEEEIRNLAFYDALTKQPNRRLFLDRFREALIISTRRNDYGAVLFIDMDRFKTLNDTLGHDYGDLLLIEVAIRVKSCVREMDTVARLGGDEFVVLIEGIGEDPDNASRKVRHIAEKIRETLAQPYMQKSHEHHSSPSIGVSLYHGNEESVDDLLQQADMAMYQAKNAGRNAVRFFDPVMQHKATSRAEIENELHHAIALGQLHLHYQVQVDNDHRPLGAEALLRWFHPQRGVVMPNDFIPIAEESTLILDIGSWAMDQTCRQLALWAGDKRMRDLTLAVNVSAKQFAQPNFVDQVAGAIRSHQINPSRLKLELTESMVVHDLKNTVDTMHALKKLGVKLSMDDFGTGYSSLSYLRDLPLDQIKIDQSFVQSITRDGNDAMLVQTIIDLAGNFHMKVIAEGVETDAQLTFLKHNDCMSYQGFLFSKALPIREFEELLVSM